MDWKRKGWPGAKFEGTSAKWDLRDEQMAEQRDGEAQGRVDWKRNGWPDAKFEVRSAKNALTNEQQEEKREERREKRSYKRQPNMFK